jgi:hypothetical protein
MHSRLMAVVLALAVAAACTDSMQTPTGPGALTAPVFVTAQHEGTAHNHRTHLSGRNEVPPNNSRAQGQAIFHVNDDGTAIRFKLNVANILNITQAHIHRAPAGVNGGIVVWLYPAAPPAQLIPGRFQGTLNEGTITSANLVGTLAGQPLSALLDEIRAGNTYVNVHTTQFPPGEIRGQIR